MSIHQETLEAESMEDKPGFAFDQKKALLSLKRSGKLDDLLLQGKEYVLMLNSDNLAEVVDPKILNHLIQNNIEYCMEVTKISNGHQPDQAAIIIASNSWVNIDAINKENHPISKFFRSSIGISVPGSRKLQLEETSDLLILQSDLYTCDKGILTRNKARTNPNNPTIKLGSEFEKVTDFQSHFKSIPSIIMLDNLKVTGDVSFGTGVVLKGLVSINARPGEKIIIPDGAVLENKAIHSQQDVPEGENSVETASLFRYLKPNRLV